MPVVNFPVAGRENCVVVAGTAYVYATLDGRGFVMNASCPHRGGPLHLAGVTPDAGRLICPWHDRKTSAARLRAEVPAVRTGNRVTAVFPDRPAADRPAADRPAADRPAAGRAAPAGGCGRTSREYRPLSPALARPGAAV
ncbi:Rieske 2Fe-2S domain-containing protein [Streptomyces sp. NPDC085540]|uniref:Rieske 2Fe-2S domain-containing protein n=1 Tax=Streptomyces sp. NPDC085540 TaxID=3365730 RepID=UPI0037CE3313